jgi:ribosome-binding factor A
MKKGGINCLMSKNETRLGRINEELKKEISHIITFELKDPDATGLISVTKVKITPDLKYAKVYVSILNSKNQEKTIKALQDASGFIRTQIAKTVNLRITPQLVFEFDDSIEYGMKIDSILKEINANETNN